MIDWLKSCAGEKQESTCPRRLDWQNFQKESEHQIKFALADLLIHFISVEKSQLFLY